MSKEEKKYGMFFMTFFWDIYKKVVVSVEIGILEIQLIIESEILVKTKVYVCTRK